MKEAGCVSCACFGLDLVSHMGFDPDLKLLQTSKGSTGNMYDGSGLWVVAISMDPDLSWL